GSNASVSLMPAIDKLLTDAGMALSEIDAIACVIGPGSFTGIRIGVSAARAMCYALGKPAVAVNYLQSLAYNERADGVDKILCVCDGSNGTAYLAELDSERK
ncbi:MAG: tRNA (adenosine(37)-N6)-threonylcarbamoyltransferase complex dimerization subunit type 1 TsaB, partial [Clostridia bacterium]|nr:tRNA (adenosine(37)-N6)-threonylcarbamoyltransferase complex dimerization subunit type 1 TsaB [Clostridia bacterium]